MDLTETPERQSVDPVDSDSHAGDIPPNRKGHRNRRRRWYLLAVIPAMLLTVGVILAAEGLCTKIGAYSGVKFDFTQVLADAARPVHVRACVPSSCAYITVKKRSSDGSIPIRGPGFGRDWDAFSSGVVEVNDPSLAWLPVTVSLTVRDQAGVPIFDSSARVQPHMYQPNGPNCEPTVYGAKVVATRTGRLVPQS